MDGARDDSVFDYIPDEAARAHIAQSQEQAEDDEIAHDPGDDDGGFGPGSYYDRAMSKDD